MGEGLRQSNYHLETENRWFLLGKVERIGSAHGGKEREKERMERKIREGKGKKSNSENLMSSFSRSSAAPEGTQRARCPRGNTAPARAAPLSFLGLACYGAAQPPAFPSGCLLGPAAATAAGPACLCL